MKKSSFFLICLFALNLSMFFLIPTQSATTTQALTIKVGVWENSPKVYSEDGEWTGFYPDIIREIARLEKWNIEFVNGTWNEGLERLENHSIDIMTDVSYSKERAEIYDFNEVALIENWGTLYTTPGLNVSKFKDLEGKRIAVMKNTAHYDDEGGIKGILTNANITVTFVELTGYNDTFKALASGTADVAVVNRLFALENEKHFDIESTPIFFNPVDLKFGFPKNGALNDILIPRIDYHLIHMKDDPESIYYQALEEYILGTPVKEVIPKWLMWVVSLTIGLGFIMSINSTILKRRVSQKTQEIQHANDTLAQDIEVRKQIEGALRESEEKFELLNKILIETMPSGVLLLDSSGRIVIINDILKQIIQGDTEKEIPQGSSLNNLPESILKKYLIDIYEKKKTLTKNEKNQTVKKTISLGNSRHFEVYFLSLVKDEDQITWGYLFVLNDVTPFVELDIMRKNFISTVSHELRTPISSLSLTLENLIEYKERLSPEQKEYMMGLMTKNTKVLAEMIEDLLITSRIDNERLKLSCEQINVIPIFNDIFAVLDGKIQDKNIEIVKDFSENIDLFADPKRISQIFRIFIDNAVKYSQNNSKVFINVKEDQDKGGYVFTISDSGIGIPEKDLAKIFSRFYRASNTTSIQGTGLGLSIAKELVEKHGGNLKLKSIENKGTTITVFLPKGKKE